MAKRGPKPRISRGNLGLRPPKWLSSEEADIYQYYVRQCGEFWTPADVDLVCCFVQLVARIRTGKTDHDKDLTHLRAISKQLGIDPMMRAKLRRELGLDKEKDDDNPLNKILHLAVSSS